MPRFAANISLLYPEWPLIDRVAAAARDGFAAIEVQQPYEVADAEWRRALDAARVQAVLINAPAGAERGLAALPGREAEFDATIVRALATAQALGVRQLHVMAGVPDADVAAADALAAYLRNIGAACRALGAHGIGVVIEPINPYDVPGYFMNRLPLALEVIERLPAPRPRLLFDAYHLQILHGDLTRRLRQCVASVGHVQVAGVPERHEPDRGEVHYPPLFAELERLGYRGWVGCEYRPADGRPGGTSAGLGWLRRC
jgi:hydroxypyruvate isomerase